MRRGLLPLALLFVWIPSGGNAQSTATAEDTVFLSRPTASIQTLDWSDIVRHPHMVRVLNDGRTSIETKIELGPFFREQDGSKAPDAFLAILGPKTFPLKPKQAGLVRFVAGPPQILPPGDYSGAIVFTAEASRVRVDIRVLVPGLIPIRARRVTVTRRSFYSAQVSDDSEILIPLLASADTGHEVPLNSGEIFLRTENADATLTAHVARLVGDSRRRFVRIVVDSVERTGLYSGSVRAQKEIPADTVQLTVLVRDQWYWPILAIALGVLLALLSQHLLNFRRPRWQLEKRLYALRDAIAKAQTLFVANWRSQVNTPPPACSITQNLLAQRDAILEALKTAPHPMFSPWDATDAVYQQLASSIAALEHAVGQWPPFGDHLGALQRAREGAVAIIKPPGRLKGPTADVGLPRAIAVADELIAPSDGHAAISLDTFAVRREVVISAITLLERWREAADQLTRLLDRLPIVAPVFNTDAGKARLAVVGCSMEGTIAQLEEVRGALWEAFDSATFDASGLSSKLLAVRQCMDSVNDLVAARLLTASEKDSQTFRANETGIGAMQEQHAQDRRRIALALPLDAKAGWNVTAWLKAADWGLAAIAFVAAVAGWALESYMDKPFGRPADYLRAFLWGYALKTGLDGLQSILGKIQGRGIPLLPR